MKNPGTTGRGWSKRWAPALGLLLLLAPLGVPAVARGETLPSILPVPSSWIVGEVRVRTQNVFDPTNPDENGWGYRLVNAVHITTRETFLAGAFPLRQGQRITEADLEEAKRIMRRFGFLRSVEVVPTLRPGGIVDLEVITRDAWTTKIGVSFGGGGGETRLRLGLEESNLLGYGKALAFEFDRTSVRTTNSISYEDPRFLDSNRKLEVEYLDNSDGNGFRSKLSLPLLRGADPFGWSIEAIRLTERIPVYEKGEVHYRIERKTTAFETEAIWTLDGTAERTLRAGVGFTPRRELYGDVEIEDETIPVVEVPTDRRRSDIYLLVRSRQLRFRSEPYINRFARVEDFSTGLDAELRAGISPDALGGDENVWIASGRLAGGFDTFAGNFGTARLETSLRHGRLAESRTGKVEAEGIGYFRIPGPFPHALGVAHLFFQHGWGLQPHEKFLLGGDNGLRGFEAHAFEGDRLFLANVEVRAAWEREWFKLIQLGVAAFVDTGLAADHRVLDLRRWRSSLGLGLRFGIPRAARNNVLRLDVAYPFSADDRGNRGYVISFGSGQAF